MGNTASFTATTWPPPLCKQPGHRAASSFRVSSPRSNVSRRRTTTHCFRNLHAGKPKEICAPFQAMWVLKEQGMSLSVPANPDAMTGGASPAVPIFGKLLILCVQTRVMEQVHRNLPALCSNALCEALLYAKHRRSPSETGIQFGQLGA